MIRLAEVQALKVRHVAGLISGTSMDGLDVAICRIGEHGDRPKIDLLAFDTVAMPEALRAGLAAERLDSVAAIARINQALGDYFVDALETVLSRAAVALHLIGSHGQTVYHEHGRTSLQLGEPGPLAARFACPVVHNFRMNDIAVGGSGAPLVPHLDQRVFGGDGAALVLLNIGGITNFTALPGRDDADRRAIGTDCGPGNMILDQLAAIRSRGALQADLDGRMAAQGSVDPALLRRLLDHPFLRADAPKSGGREQFGSAYVEALLAATRPASDQDWFDLFATVTELTAVSVAEACRRFVLPVRRAEALVVAGGGARNPMLMARLAAAMAPMPVTVSDDYGIPVDAKEAIAFALLAYDRIDGRAANVPSVTGAGREALLGQITEC
jgi:anhydro-N-acetylmuramic acid kinase